MMRDKNRRTTQRAATEEWAIRNTENAVLDAEHQSASEIRLVDISADGIGIKTTDPLSKDRVISFDLCFSNQYYRVVARVLWTQKLGASWRSGLQILHMPEDLMDEIEEYLETFEKPNALN